MRKEGDLLWTPVQDAGLTALVGALSGSAELGSALFFCLTDFECMETFLISSGLVALVELGDKVQFLAFLLAAKYRKPVPVCLALIVATIASHALGGGVALAMGQFMKADSLRWVLCVSFVGLAAWSLSSDPYEEKEEKPLRFGVFGAALVAFFLAELGGKAQVATVVMAAQSKAIFEVVAGTTLGMLAVNLPAVVLGDRCSGRLPVDAAHWLGAGLFAVLAYFAYFGGGAPFGF